MAPPYNKSLDASGISGLVIDNLSVTWLFPAASTPPFGAAHKHREAHCHNFGHHSYGADGG
jgi:hypothetical protein